MMRLLSMMLIVAGLMMAATGCLEMEQSIEIAKDGRMTVSYRYAMTPENRKLLGQAQGGVQSWQQDRTVGTSSSLTDLNWIFNEDQVKRFFSLQGMAVKDYKLREDKAMHEVTFRVVCKDAMAALASGRFGPFEVRRRPDGQVANGLTEIISTLEKPRRQVSDADWKKLCEACSGLKVKLSLNVPGEIIETDGKKQEHGAAWSIESERDLEMLRKPPRFRLLYRPPPEG